MYAGYPRPDIDLEDDDEPGVLRCHRCGERHTPDEYRECIEARYD